MRFGKAKKGSLVLAMGLAAMPVMAMAYVATQQQNEQDDVAARLQNAANKMTEQRAWDISQEQQEKMRSAMRGEGDYALPEASLEENQYITEEDKEHFRRQIESIDSATQEMERKGWFDEVRSAQQTQRAKAYEALADSTIDTSLNNLEKALQEHAGLSEKQAGQMAGRGDPTEREAAQSEHAIFISFSMTHDAIRSALIRAKQQGAMVYVNGLHPNHHMINETMNLMRMIGRDIENPPMTRFNPEAFEEYSVTQVPTILYREGEVAATASGILNLGWVKDELQERGESVNLGNFGPTSKVIERSIIEEMQERMAKIDWQAKQKQAVETYWQKRDFSVLPRAEKDETWFIDPTVRAAADIKTPQEQLLARKGEVVNPLVNRSKNLNIIVFDALDPEQREWLAAHLESTQYTGQVMLITTQLDRKDGWKQIEELMRQYRQRIYLLPSEMIEKFHLTGTPAEVTTLLDRDLLKITQFKI